MFLPSNDKDPVRLFEAFKHGDHRAFRYFFEQEHGYLYKIILRIVDSKEEAKDIVAEAFHKLWLDRGRINDTDHLARYLFIVARNGAIDFFRRQHYRRKANDELSRLGEPEYTDPKEAEAMHILLLEKIALAVKAFSPRQKKIFLQTYFKGADPQSLAHLLHIEAQTVRNHKSRAINALRRALE